MSASLGVGINLIILAGISHNLDTDKRPRFFVSVGLW